MLKEKRTRSLI